MGSEIASKDRANISATEIAATLNPASWAYKGGSVRRIGTIIACKEIAGRA